MYLSVISLDPKFPCIERKRASFSRMRPLNSRDLIIKRNELSEWVGRRSREYQPWFGVSRRIPSHACLLFIRKVFKCGSDRRQFLILLYADRFVYGPLTVPDIVHLLGRLILALAMLTSRFILGCVGRLTSMLLYVDK